MLQGFDFESYLNVMFSSYLIKTLLIKARRRRRSVLNFMKVWGRSPQKNFGFAVNTPLVFHQISKQGGVSVVIPTNTFNAVSQ